MTSSKRMHKMVTAIATMTAEIVSRHWINSNDDDCQVEVAFF